MPKNMRGASASKANTRTTHGLCHDHGDGTVTGKRAKWRAGSNEECVVADRAPGILEVVDDRIANLLSHGEKGLAAAFSHNPNGRFLPAKVVDAKPKDIASTKADAGDQQQNRAVSDCAYRKSRTA